MAENAQIRIVPMDAAAIHNQDYRQFFTQTVIKRGGKYYFSKRSLNAPSGTLLLFQLESHLVACARLLGKYKQPVTNEWGENQGGYYVLDPDSIRLADPPVSIEAFRSLVPEFKDKRFSNAMQFIPTEYETAILSAFGTPNSANNSDETSLELTSIVESGFEGKKTAYYTTKYERDPRNRELAIKAHGVKCQACGFDFEKVYGKLGEGFIEVHHIKPLFSLGEETKVDPAKDMVCLCSNCHRMVHRKRGEILSIEELVEIIKKSTDADR